MRSGPHDPRPVEGAYEPGFVPVHGSGPFFCSKADMAGILIIAHAPFATALRDCISHIYGGLPARIGVMDVSPNCEPTEMVAFAHSEIERLQAAMQGRRGMLCKVVRGGLLKRGDEIEVREQATAQGI